MADSAIKEPTALDHLRDRREERVKEWDEVIRARDTERRAFAERQESDEFKQLEDEKRGEEVEAFKTAEQAFRDECDRRESELKGLDEEIQRREDLDRRLQQAAEASKNSPSLSIEHEPMTYRSDNARGLNGRSYYRDLAMVELGLNFQTGGTRDQAQARLNQHAKEIETVMPERAKRAEQNARRQVAEAENDFLARMVTRDPKVDRVLEGLRSNGLQFNPFEQRVEPNVAQGYGGYFVPPLWLVDEYIPGLRAHLIVAGFPRQMDLPPGTDSINIPKLQTLTTVGYQQMNNAGLPSQDWTDTFVQANVKTIGGYSDVALQLLEQSPHGIVDEVVTTDLMAAYNKFLDGEVIAGDGTNTNTLNGGHLLGIYNGSGGSGWSGVNTVTYTDGSPSPAHMAQGVFGPMASKIAGTRFDASNFKIALHGSRWFWYSTGPDVNGRPLGETLGGGPYNVQARLNAPIQAEGLVGSLPYLADAPVYIDDNISTSDTTGGGSNQDLAIAGLWDDAWLFKGALRMEVFREVLSGSLGVRFRAYNYAAFLVRYGQSFAVATGSGFARPSTGYGDYFR